MSVKNRKGEIMLEILGLLKEMTADVGDLFEAYMKAGYGASYGKLECEKSRARKRGVYAEKKTGVEREARQRFSKFMYKLSSDGLVERRGSEFVITKKG